MLCNNSWLFSILVGSDGCDVTVTVANYHYGFAFLGGLCTYEQKLEYVPIFHTKSALVSACETSVDSGEFEIKYFTSLL